MTTKVLSVLISASVLIGTASGALLDAQGRPTAPLILESTAGRDSFRFNSALDGSEPRVRLRLDSLVRNVESFQRPAAPEQPGARLFRTYCATCRGPNAQGGGPLADRLRHAPPDLTRYTERNDGIFPTERVHRIIDGREVPSHGDRDMPVWGDAFRSEPDGLTADQAKARIDAIVGYLRAIQRRDAE